MATTAERIAELKRQLEIETENSIKESETQIPAAINELKRLLSLVPARTIELCSAEGIIIRTGGSGSRVARGTHKPTIEDLDEVLKILPTKKNAMSKGAIRVTMKDPMGPKKLTNALNELRKNKKADMTGDKLSAKWFKV